MKKRNSTDHEILRLWTELSPSPAFVSGIREAAGKLFVPSPKNIERAVERINSLRQESESELQRKVLDAIETELDFDEPQAAVGQILDAFSFYLIKEGINEKHMLSLLKYADKALSAAQERCSKRDWAVGIRVLAQLRCAGLAAVLDTIAKESKGRKKLKEGVAKFRGESLSPYTQAFGVDGFSTGSFLEIKEILEKGGAALGRESFYPRALSKAYDYYETSDELEAKALSWLDEEVPLLERARKRIALVLGCPNSSEAIKKALAKKSVSPKQLLGVTKQVRLAFQKLVKKNVVGINPKYRTKVIETPAYLTGILPTAAAGFFDTFTKRPYQVYFITTDEKRDPMSGLADLLSTLAHEEYGHCVHHSNSAYSYAAKPSILELMSTTHAGPISEGLSFQRELEFLEAMKEFGKKTPKTKDDSKIVSTFKKYGGIEDFLAELEYITRVGRITRFLRVVGDARINSGKQNLLDFLQWAEEKSGLPQEHVYHQIFPAHEGQFPGYATCYAVVGQEIKEIQQKLKNRKQLVKFNSYACSMGYPPRSIYINRLREYADGLVASAH
jgi:hypothetical protein